MPNFLVRGKAMPLLIDNIDTDQIIAAEHLKTLTRQGLGAHALAGLVANASQLRDPRYSKAPIILAGRNFGCGSSREHAVWAILDRGVKAVIAPSFSDIFAGNAFKNGLLTVTLPLPALGKIIELAEHDEVAIDLNAQVVSAGTAAFAFDFDPFRRECLLSGTDEIGLTLRHDEDIVRFEARHAGWSHPS